MSASGSAHSGCVCKRPIACANVYCKVSTQPVKNPWPLHSDHIQSYCNLLYDVYSEGYNKIYNLAFTTNDSESAVPHLNIFKPFSKQKADRQKAWLSFRVQVPLNDTQRVWNADILLLIHIHI